MAEKNVSIGVLAALGAVVALAGLPADMAAQEANNRMALQPFLGCWQPDGEEEEAGILCFVADGSRVEMLTVAEGGITHRELFAVDGQLRRIEQDGCTGEESARFSDDHQRIYTTSSMTCAGEPPRSGTGIIFMPEADEWVDVRAIAADDSEVTAWAQWYVRTGESELNDLGIESGRYTAPLAVRAMAGGARARITIDDVIDASRNVHEKAVEAWIAEVGQEFAGLDVDDLVELDGAGVSGNLIDVIVAVSFPRAFRAQPAAAGPGSDGLLRRPSDLDRSLLLEVGIPVRQLLLGVGIPVRTLSQLVLLPARDRRCDARTPERRGQGDRGQRLQQRRFQPRIHREFLLGFLPDLDRRRFIRTQQHRQNRQGARRQQQSVELGLRRQFLHGVGVLAGLVGRHAGRRGGHEHRADSAAAWRQQRLTRAARARARVR